MKIPALLFTAFLSLSCLSPGQNQPPEARIPANLAPKIEIIRNEFPKMEAKRLAKAPADSVWQFRAVSNAKGTVEIAFQGDEVVYLIFRRGLGGEGWTNQQIKDVHMQYHQDLLNEQYDPSTGTFSKYNHTVAKQTATAIIFRKDFDVRSLMTGL